MCCSVTVFSLTFLIVFGFWLAEITSFLCVASVLLAVVFNIFLLEYAYIFIYKTISYKKGKYAQEQIKRLNTVEIIENVELQREILYSKHGSALLRPSFQKQYSDLSDGDMKVVCLFCIFLTLYLQKYTRRKES